MHRAFFHLRYRRSAPVWLALAVLLASCQSQTQIRPARADKNESGEVPQRNTDTLDSDGKSQADNGDDGDSGLETAKGSETDAISYPVLKFVGTGQVTNDAHPFPINAKVTTTMDEGKLEIDMTDAKVDCSSKCNASKQAETDADVQRDAVGVSLFTRPSVDELDDAGSGFRQERFLVYANQARKHNGVTYRFDQPVPVFPLPAKEKWMRDLETGTIDTWSARVNGGEFDVQIRVRVTSASISTVRIEFDTTILQDTGDRKLYNDFPIPRRATYEISVADRDVRQIQAENWFYSEKSNQPESIDITYNLCEKTRKGDTDTFRSCNW